MTRLVSRLGTLVALLGACLPSISLSLAQDTRFPANPAKAPRAKAAQEPSPPAAPFTPQREARALAFVKNHHPELARLLVRLEPMNRAEYEKAILDIAQVDENLTRIRERDPRRFELALAAWKARSRAEWLAAQLVGRSERSARLESQLRQALSDQIDAEIERQTYEREQAQVRVERAQRAIQDLQSRRESLIEQRFQRLRKSQIGPKSGGVVARPTVDRVARPRGEEGNPR